MAAKKQQAEQGKALTANNNNNNNNNNPTQAEGKKQEFKQLQTEEIAAILQGYINEEGGFLSMSALKKRETDFTAKYGRSNWISLRSAFQSGLIRCINGHADSAKEAAHAYAPALIDQWARIASNPDFIALADYIGIKAAVLAKEWRSGADFVAACYPTQVEGLPAVKRPYVSKNSGFIVDVIERRTLSADIVPAILSACIDCIKRAAVKTLRKAALQRLPVTTYEAGQIVAGFALSHDEEGRACKGDAVSPGIFAALQKEGAQGLRTLAEFRQAEKEAKKEGKAAE